MTLYLYIDVMDSIDVIINKNKCLNIMFIYKDVLYIFGLNNEYFKALFIVEIKRKRNYILIKLHNTDKVT